MARQGVKVGDVFEIPLSDGRKAYGQYVFLDQKMGPLVQIFDLICEDEIQLDQLKEAKPLFPPVITGLLAAIRTGLWRVIGHMPVEGFVYPNFVSTFYNDKTGQAGVWFLWDGKKSKRIGDKLPEKCKQLEFLVVWDPHDVVHRIETGEYPYPFGSLIKDNRFDVQEKLIASTTTPTA
jgi:hypothetical protein